MSNPTRQQIAESYALWCEYVDADATMTREEFDAMTVDQRLDLMTEAFGAEPQRVTIDGHEVSFDAAINLMDGEIREELHSTLPEPITPQAFADAYCAAHAAKFGAEFAVD